MVEQRAFLELEKEYIEGKEYTEVQVDYRLLKFKVPCDISFTLASLLPFNYRRVEMVFLWHYKAWSSLLMPGLFSAADPIWQYKFDANSSRYACASSILFSGFDILRAYIT